MNLQRNCSKKVADLHMGGKHFSKQYERQPPVHSFVTVFPLETSFEDSAELSHISLREWWFAAIHRGSRN